MSTHGLQSVTLRVPQLSASQSFYHELVGLEVVSESDDTGVLGAGGEPIVRLVDSPEAPRRGAAAGLFHAAILFPDRRSLADALTRLTTADYRLTGAADHAVSEALYMDDPAGNGIELYRDRPSSAWERDASGDVRMTTDRLDVAGLRGEASPATPATAPAGTSLGHVHLEVTDLERSLSFYREVLGMALQTTRRGAAFVSWEGYHHHVALNTWKQRHNPHDPKARGLSAVTATVPEESLVAIQSRATELNRSVEETDGQLRLTDPDGVTWRLHHPTPPQN